MDSVNPEFNPNDFCCKHESPHAANEACAKN